MKDAIEYLAYKDPRFKIIIDTYGVPMPVVRPEGFESLYKIILEQQVSLESARACYQKLLAITGDFRPAQIASLPDEAMRGCGVSRQKTVYLRELAAAVSAGRVVFETMRDRPAGEVHRELVAVKGIGAWTADVYLMFCLQSPDIIPLSDIGIVVTIRELWGIEGRAALEALTDNWKPYRTLASFLLWHYYLRKRNRVIHA